MEDFVIYSPQDVLGNGFEALCAGPDGARYLHRDRGVRVDALTRQTKLLTDPAALPDSMSFPTVLRLERRGGVERTRRKRGMSV